MLLPFLLLFSSEGVLNFLSSLTFGLLIILHIRSCCSYSFNLSWRTKEAEPVTKKEPLRGLYWCSSNHDYLKIDIRKKMF
jgi:hypothetical protein